MGIHRNADCDARLIRPTDRTGTVLLFVDVIRRLETGLRAELPGVAAQTVLAPVPRREWPAGFNPARARNAAGLLLVFPIHERAHVVLTVRSETVGRHSGQVSLPGGAVEPGETFEHAALREAHEEIALARDGITVLGALTPLDIPVSGFRLHPIVAVRHDQPSFVAADGEVARILQVPIADLIRSTALRHTRRVRDGRPFTVPAFYVHGTEIWGATAMVLAEFLALLGWRPASTP
jgi:8-oxo-dGTP pyrophosphatase MutT (NUDIX family)